MVAVKEVYVADISADGTLRQPKMLVSDLPDGGQHPNPTLAFGRDLLMYLTVDSTCNACAKPNPENAMTLRANADGSNPKIYAKGLRNTIGFGWHPETRELWGLRNQLAGRQWAGRGGEAAQSGGRERLAVYL